MRSLCLLRSIISFLQLICSVCSLAPGRFRSGFVSEKDPCVSEMTLIFNLQPLNANFGLDRTRKMSGTALIRALVLFIIVNIFAQVATGPEDGLSNAHRFGKGKPART